MNIELAMPGTEVVYHGNKFPKMKGEKVDLVKHMECGKRSVIQYAGEGYIVAVSNLHVSKGVDTWDGSRNFADLRRKDGRREVSLTEDFE